MGYLVLLAVLAVAGWLVLRGFGRPVEPERVTRRPATTLERDPESGVYRPAERDRS